MVEINTTVVRGLAAKTIRLLVDAAIDTDVRDSLLKSAGLFDGEGCVRGNYTRYGGTRFEIKMNTVDGGCARFSKFVYSIGIDNCNEHKEWREGRYVYKMCVTKQSDLITLARALLPVCEEKRWQLAILLYALKDTGCVGYTLSEECRVRRSRCVAALSNLKRRRPGKKPPIIVPAIVRDNQVTFVWRGNVNAAVVWE